jgi:signal transduction histidine kinase
MRRLIESLLELARLDAGPDVDRRQPLDLAQVAEESVALVQSLAADRRVRLHVALSPAPCHGNADHLTLVVTNLLTNAIHYNREGGEVRIVTAIEAQHAVVTVADTGIGIAAEHVPHIFERFYRADAARTAAQGRTGLGLAITKSIVAAHGGTIEVTSEPGQGSSFKVRLPV